MRVELNVREPVREPRMWVKDRQVALLVQEDRPGEDGLEKLVCRVLRSTLEQVRTRQTKGS
jgi:hypothetical protein